MTYDEKDFSRNQIDRFSLKDTEFSKVQTSFLLLNFR